MNKLFLSLLCAIVAMVSLPGHADDKPVFHKYSFDDAAIVLGMSDNGAWAVAHAALSDSHEGTKGRLINVATNEVIELQTAADIASKGSCTVSDVTDDGNIVVGAYAGRPAYWTKSTGKWTSLPVPSGCNGGSIIAVTPDGRYAVGSGSYTTNEYQEKGVMWDLTSNTIVELTNIPTKDMQHEDMDQTRFTHISADGRYFLAIMSFSYVFPPQSCGYVYDVQNNTYKFLGFTPSETEAWTPMFKDMIAVSDPQMSPNGKWVIANGNVVLNPESSVGDEYNAILKYNVETDETVLLDNTEDRDMMPCFVDDAGTVYAATPASVPLRDWSVKHENYWYSINDILKQKYGVDFEAKTGYDYTGTPMFVSSDGTTFGTMVSPAGDSYILTLPESAVTACAAINLLDNYTVSPASGSTFSKLKILSVTFDRNVALVNSDLKVDVKDEAGNVVKQSSKVEMSTTDATTIVLSFLRLNLTEGKKYTIEIPAGAVCIAGDESKLNNAITMEYFGRANKSVEPTVIYPANNSEIAKIDNSSNPVIVTFDTDISKTDSAKATLIRTTDGTEMCSLLTTVSGNKLGIYPSTTQYLFAGQTYRVVLGKGAVTDLTGNGPNAEMTIDYTGTYERVINTEDETLFSDDFSNASQSFINFIRFEGDHNTPTAEMTAWEFDADNQPWNFSIRDEDGSNYCAASHSMYTPAGKSDDWMVISQLSIPDEFCTLSFDAQSYMMGKEDRLKVLVWEHDDIINELSTSTVNQMKAEAEVVFNEVLSPGLSQDELAGDWVRYNIDLAKYSGKNIYIAFLNDNEDQSAVFVDSVVVKRSMKYLLSLSNDAVVVDKESVPIAGKVTINSETDTYGSVALTLLDASGAEIDKVSADGLSLGKNDTYPFAFTKELPLVKGKANNFSIKVQLDNYQDVMKSSVKSLAFEPTKRVVLEEMTGTTCVNCPLGILAIENMEKSFGSQFIPISIHTYTGDPFGAGLSGYSSYLGLTSAPTGVVNRSGEITAPMQSYRGDYSFSNGSTLWFDKVTEELKTPADADINAKVTVDETAGTFAVPVTVRYALDAKNLNLNLFFVVLEDGILGNQSNNFGSVSDPDLGEWGAGGKNQAGTVYNVTHNDVVRTCLSSYGGVGGYLPQTMTAGTEYTADVRGIAIPENIDNLNKAKVVVMLIDANTDKVVNSVCVLFPGYAEGIDNATAGDAGYSITAANGKVNVTASGAVKASLYTTAGTLLGTAGGNGGVSVSASSYRGPAIVKVVTDQGTVTRKLMVK